MSKGPQPHDANNASNAEVQTEAVELNEQALAKINNGVATAPGEAQNGPATAPTQENEAQVNSAVMAVGPLSSAFATTNSNVAEEKALPVVTEANREDETLVRRIMAGDTEAFAQIVDRYKVAVYNLCVRMLHDQFEAEDAAQEIFLRVYNQISSYTPGRRFSTWVLSIASHYCIDVLRRRRPTLDLDSIAFWKSSDRPEPEENAVTMETRDEVRDLLKSLPEKYRTVTVLRYWQDLSYEEIAQATNLTVATVKTRLFRARELLAKELDKQRRSGNSNEADKTKREAGKTAKVRGSQNVLP